MYIYRALRSGYEWFLSTTHVCAYCNGICQRSRLEALFTYKRVIVCQRSFSRQMVWVLKSNSVFSEGFRAFIYEKPCSVFLRTSHKKKMESTKMILSLCVFNCLCGIVRTAFHPDATDNDLRWGQTPTPFDIYIPGVHHFSLDNS